MQTKELTVWHWYPECGPAEYARNPLPAWIPLTCHGMRLRRNQGSEPWNITYIKCRILGVCHLPLSLLESFPVVLWDVFQNYCFPPMNPKGDFVEHCGLNVNESTTQEMPAFDTAGSGSLPTSWIGGLQLSLSLFGGTETVTRLLAASWEQAWASANPSHKSNAQDVAWPSSQWKRSGGLSWPQAKCCWKSQCRLRL